MDRLQWREGIGRRWLQQHGRDREVSQTRCAVLPPVHGVGGQEVATCSDWTQLASSLVLFLDLIAQNFIVRLDNAEGICLGVGRNMSVWGFRNV